MNNNFKVLFIGTSLSLIPQYAAAQCAVTDCQQLGYTSLQKCDNGLKCPFGEYWACPKVEEKAVLGQCNGYAKNCKIGDILNSDGTCSNDKVSGKTPIGVVVYIGSDNCGQALSLQELGKYVWLVQEVMCFSIIGPEVDEFDSCGNTQKLTGWCFEAARGARGYAPSSVPTTKGKWCLPAAGVGQSILDNYDKINSGFSKAGGEKLPRLNFHDAHGHWLSEGYDANALFLNYSANAIGFGAFDNDLYVRPVLAF